MGWNDEGGFDGCGVMVGDVNVFCFVEGKERGIRELFDMSP